MLAGVDVVGLVPAGAVYADERRSLGPPRASGSRSGDTCSATASRFDVVHTAAFPFFPLLAGGLARRRTGYRLVADWYEVWSRELLAALRRRLVGTAGWLVQRGASTFGIARSASRG